MNAGCTHIYGSTSTDNLKETIFRMMIKVCVCWCVCVCRGNVNIKQNYGTFLHMYNSAYVNTLYYSWSIVF